jgi:hypothetical protein
MYVGGDCHDGLKKIKCILLSFQDIDMTPSSSNYKPLAKSLDIYICCPCRDGSRNLIQGGYLLISHKTKN